MIAWLHNMKQQNEKNRMFEEGVGLFGAVEDGMGRWQELFHMIVFFLIDYLYDICIDGSLFLMKLN